MNTKPETLNKSKVELSVKENSFNKLVQESEILILLERVVTNPEQLKIIQEQQARFAALAERNKELASFKDQRVEFEVQMEELYDQGGSDIVTTETLNKEIGLINEKIKAHKSAIKDLEKAINQIKPEIAKIQSDIVNNRPAVDQISQQYATSPDTQGGTNSTEYRIPAAYAAPRSMVDMSGGNTQSIENSTSQKSSELSKLKNDREEMGREYIRLKQAGAKKSVLDEMESDIAKLDALIKQHPGAMPVIDTGSIAQPDMVQPDVAHGPQIVEGSNTISSIKTPDAIPYVGFSGQFPSESGNSITSPEQQLSPEQQRAIALEQINAEITEARLQWLEAQKQEEVRLKGGLYSNTDAREKRALKRAYDDLKFKRMQMFGADEKFVVASSIDKNTGAEVVHYKSARQMLLEEENLALNADRTQIGVKEGKLPLKYRLMDKVNKALGIPGKAITAGLVAGGMNPETAQKIAPWVNRCAFAGVAAATGGLGALGFVGMVGMSTAVGSVVATTIGAADKLAQKMGYRDANAMEVRGAISGELSMKALAAAEALELDRTQGKKKIVRDFVKAPAAIGLGKFLGGWVNEHMPHDRTTVINTCDENGNPLPTPATPAPAVSTDHAAPVAQVVAEKSSWTQRLFGGNKTETASYNYADESTDHVENVSRGADTNTTTPVVKPAAPAGQAEPQYAQIRVADHSQQGNYENYSRLSDRAGTYYNQVPNQQFGQIVQQPNVYSTIDQGIRTLGDIFRKPTQIIVQNGGGYQDVYHNPVQNVYTPGGLNNAGYHPVNNIPDNTVVYSGGNGHSVNTGFGNTVVNNTGNSVNSGFGTNTVSGNQGIGDNTVSYGSNNTGFTGSGIRTLGDVTRVTGNASAAVAVNNNGFNQD